MTTDEIIEKYRIQINEALTDLKTPGKRIKQLPNIITLGRLLSPFAIIPTALFGNSDDAIKLAAFFGLTDMLDGFIARNWDLSSPLGADLDALTDKMFAGTLLLTGAITNPCLLANTGLEMAIAGINLKQKFSGNKSGSTIMGKVKTGAVFTLGGLGVVATSIEELDKVILPLSVATGLLQAMTIASYLKKYNNDSNRKTQNNNKNEELLEKLKEESAFLHQELENRKGTESIIPMKEQLSPPKVSQKVKI